MYEKQRNDFNKVVWMILWGNHLSQSQFPKLVACTMNENYQRTFSTTWLDKFCYSSNFLNLYFLCLWLALWMKIKPKKNVIQILIGWILCFCKEISVCMLMIHNIDENVGERKLIVINSGWISIISVQRSQPTKLLFCVELNSFRVGGTVCQLLWINVTGWDCLRDQVSLGRNVRAGHCVKAQTFHTLISYNRSNRRWLENT